MIAEFFILTIGQQVKTKIVGRYLKTKNISSVVLKVPNNLITKSDFSFNKISFSVKTCLMTSLPFLEFEKRTENVDSSFALRVSLTETLCRFWPKLWKPSTFEQTTLGLIRLFQLKHLMTKIYIDSLSGDIVSTSGSKELLKIKLKMR